MTRGVDEHRLNPARRAAPHVRRRNTYVRLSQVQGRRRLGRARQRHLRLHRQLREGRGLALPHPVVVRQQGQPHGQAPQDARLGVRSSTKMRFWGTVRAHLGARLGAGAHSWRVETGVRATNVTECLCRGADSTQGRGVSATIAICLAGTFIPPTFRPCWGRTMPMSWASLG